MTNTETDWKPLVRDMAIQYGCDPALILAMITVESSGNPYAMRYEPQYQWLYRVDHFVRTLRVSRVTEDMQQRTSWGLMQIMGAVARERGCRLRYLSQLTDPEEGLGWGIGHVHWLREAKGYTGHDLISAYNQGSAQRLPDGRYTNQRYVDKVLAAMEGSH